MIETGRLVAVAMRALFVILIDPLAAEDSDCLNRNPSRSARNKATGAKCYFDEIIVNGEFKNDYSPIKGEKIIVTPLN